MSPPQVPSAADWRAELRELGHSLAAAQDRKLLEVVAMLDRMAERGPADELLKPLRERLSLIRPERPLRFARLMFMPVDCLLVAPGAWKRDPLTLPRSALLPLARQVHAELETLGRQVDHMLVDRTTSDHDAIMGVGSLLWPAAAEILARAPLPAGWAEAGLGPRDHTLITTGLVSILRQAAEIEAICQAHATGLRQPDERVTALLGARPDQSPRVWSMLCIILLERVPGHPALRQIPALARRLPEGSGRLAVESVLEAVLQRAEARQGATAWLATAGPAALAAEARQIGGMLKELQALPVDAEQARRCEALRRDLAEGCARRFGEMLETSLTGPLLAAAQSAPPAAAQMIALTRTARQLRRLEMAGAQLGASPAYDTALTRTAAKLRDPAWCAGLGRVDRVRLLEVLVGADAAMRYLAEGL